MKIYFEDDKLLSGGYLTFVPDYTIDATNGYANCLAQLELLHHTSPNCTVYTNSLAALMYSEYFWNNDENVPELYMRNGEHYTFTRVDNISTRKLKATHNFLRLYLCNEFNSFNPEFRTFK